MGPSLETTSVVKDLAMLNLKQTCTNHHDHNRFAAFFLRPVQKSAVNSFLISTVLWCIFFKNIISVGI